MPFEPAPSRTPVDIGDITLYLTDRVESDNPNRSAHAQVRVLMSDGSTWVWTGDLWPHINQTAKDALLDFATYLRNLAESEMLPEGISLLVGKEDTS